MDVHENISRIEVLPAADTGRRRHWTDEKKISIVLESMEAGASLTEVARRHEISCSQLYDWRYRYKNGLLGPAPGFARVITIADEAVPEQPAALSPPELLVKLKNSCRIVIPAGLDMDAAAQLIRALQ